MLETVGLALASTVIAAIPVWVSRRRVLLNPALYIWLMVVWSVLFKVAYVLILRPVPWVGRWDPVYVFAESADVFRVGAWIVSVAMCGYVVGYLLPRRRRPVPLARIGAWRSASPRFARAAIATLSVLSLVAFGLYLMASGADLSWASLSGKRFAPASMGVASRFAYGPYYLFKLALLSASISYAAVFLALRGDEDHRLRGVSLMACTIYGIALVIAHFASLRLFILLAAAQIALLAYYLRARQRALFILVLVALTLASFLTITVIHRGQRAEPANVVVEVEPETESGGTDALPPVSKEAVPSIAAEPDPPIAAEGLAAPGEAPSPDAGTQPGASGRPAGASWAARLAASGLGGRYFFDFTKLAHIGHHFPSRQPYLFTGAFAGIFMAPTALRTDAEPRPTNVNRYLAMVVFNEPRNDVPPGYAGELYIGFGWPGVLIGFLLLGLLHRMLYDRLLRVALPPSLGACLVLLVPISTIALVNSGLASAIARAALDIGVFLVVFPPLFLLDRLSVITPRGGDDERHVNP